MPDRTTRADTSVKKDHTEEMPQAEATLRAENQQPMDEPKVLETVEKRDIMEKLYLMMKQFDQSFQELRKQMAVRNQRLEQMELQIVRTIESLSPTTRTKWREEVLEETSIETLLHVEDNKVDDETSQYDHDEELNDDTDKEDDLQEITEESISNTYSSDQKDEDNTSDLDEINPNDTDKDQNDESISSCWSEDKFQNDSDSKNV